MIDSSPMYGRAETVIGELGAKLKLRESLFLATKVWTTGRDVGIKSMEHSLDLLGTKKLDLMQVHNLVDARTHLATLREWKQQVGYATSGSRITPPEATRKSRVCWRRRLSILCRSTTR